jgi:hypothetical protein
MLFLTAPSSRKDLADCRSDRDGKMTKPSLVRWVLARRYKILEMVDLDSFLQSQDMIVHGGDLPSKQLANFSSRNPAAGLGQDLARRSSINCTSLRRYRFMETPEKSPLASHRIWLLPDGHSSPKVNVPDLVSSKSTIQRSV